MGSPGGLRVFVVVLFVWVVVVVCGDLRPQNKAPRIIKATLVLDSRWENVKLFWLIYVFDLFCKVRNLLGPVVEEESCSACCGATMRKPRTASLLPKASIGLQRRPKGEVREMQCADGCCFSSQIGVEFGTKIISLGNRQIKLQPVPQSGSESLSP